MKKDKYNLFRLKAIVILSIGLLSATLVVTDATHVNPLYIFAGVFILMIVLMLLMPEGHERLRSTEVDSQS